MHNQQSNGKFPRQESLLIHEPPIHGPLIQELSSQVERALEIDEASANFVVQEREGNKALQNAGKGCQEEGLSNAYSLHENGAERRRYE